MAQPPNNTDVPGVPPLPPDAGVPGGYPAAPPPGPVWPSPQVGYPAPGYPAGGLPVGGYAGTGYPMGYPPAGSPQAGLAPQGYPGYQPPDYSQPGPPGYQVPGYPQPGYPSAPYGQPGGAPPSGPSRRNRLVGVIVGAVALIAIVAIVLAATVFNKPKTQNLGPPVPAFSYPTFSMPPIPTFTIPSFPTFSVPPLPSFSWPGSGSSRIPTVDGTRAKFGTTAHWADGTTLSISAPQPFTPSKTSVMQAGRTAVKFHIVLYNASANTMNGYEFLPDVESGGQIGDLVFDFAQHITLAPDVAPGAQQTFDMAFGVVDPGSVTVKVSPGILQSILGQGYDEVTFVQ